SSTSVNPYLSSMRTDRDRPVQGSRLSATSLQSARPTAEIIVMAIMYLLPCRSKSTPFCRHPIRETRVRRDYNKTCRRWFGHAGECLVQHRSESGGGGDAVVDHKRAEVGNVVDVEQSIWMIILFVRRPTVEAAWRGWIRDSIGCRIHFAVHE